MINSLMITRKLKVQIIFTSQKCAAALSGCDSLTSLRLHIGVFALLAMAESDGRHCEHLWLLGPEITETTYAHWQHMLQVD